MATMTATNKSNVPELDEGVYDAKIISQEDTKSTRDNQPQVMVKFELADEMDDSGHPLQLRQWYPVYPDVRSRSKIYGLFSAVLYNGQPIPEGDPLDTAELVGRRCQVWWGSYTKQDGTTGYGIVKISPPKKKSAKRPVIVDDDDDDDLADA